MYGGAGLLLLAAVGGFWVLERAASHRGELQRVGRILGSLVIILSLLGVACTIWYKASGKYGHGLYGKAWKCPYAQKALRSAPDR